MNRHSEEPHQDYQSVELPVPEHDGDVSVEAAIHRRRSIRDFRNTPLSLQEISQILWAAQGITEPGAGLRSAPSAGAMYPLEVYLVAGSVIDLTPGLYRYQPDGHALITYHEGDLRADISRGALGQPFIKQAPASIVLTAIFERTTSRYGKRGHRYVHMDVGHAGENIYLQCAALNLGTVAVGAFRDEQLLQILGLSGEARPLYIMPIGRPA